MSILETLHEEHKARLARINAAAARKKPAPIDTLSLIQEVEQLRDKLQEFIENRNVTLTSCDRIQMAVAAHYGVSRRDLISDRRTQDIVRPRHVAMYLCKKLTLLSQPQIGRKFSGRDHTTVLHAVRKINAEMETDIHLRASVEMLTEKLGG